MTNAKHTPEAMREMADRLRNAGNYRLPREAATMLREIADELSAQPSATCEAVALSDFVMVPRELSGAALHTLELFDADKVGNNPSDAANECWGKIIDLVAKMPPVLKFTNHVFKPDRNTTVRRGRKWLHRSHALIDLGDENPSMLATISTNLMPFHLLTDNWLRDEHDPSCRTVDGLLEEMKRIYPGFKPYEDVTLVDFHLPEYITHPPASAVEMPDGYIELNLSNYNEDDVARLNDWAIRAHMALSAAPSREGGV